MPKRSLSLCGKTVIVLTEARESVYYCSLALGHSERCPYPHHLSGKKYLVEENFDDKGTYYRGGSSCPGLSSRELTQYRNLLY
jgi:hypothetical protein